jgi:hypothetical protein
LIRVRSEAHQPYPGNQCFHAGEQAHTFGKKQIHEDVRLFSNAEFEQRDGQNGVDAAQHVYADDEEQQAGMVPVQDDVGTVTVGDASNAFTPSTVTPPPIGKKRMAPATIDRGALVVECHLVRCTGNFIGIMRRAEKS